MPGPYDLLPPPRSGRTSFYEEYGVIGDVLQNHLTEILMLVAMELPLDISSSEAVLGHKLQAFRALRGLQRGSAVVGQYQAYRGQVRRELQKPDSFHSLTPTFAGGLRGWARAAGPPPTRIPQTEAVLPNRTPFRLGWKGLEVGFSHGCSVASKKCPCLSDLPPAQSSGSPAGSLWAEDTSVMVSIQSTSTDPARARQSGLRPGFALVELTSAPREAAGLPAAAGGTPSGRAPRWSGRSGSVQGPSSGHFHRLRAFWGKLAPCH